MLISHHNTNLMWAELVSSHRTRQTFAAFSIWLEMWFTNVGQARSGRRARRRGVRAVHSAARSSFAAAQSVGSGMRWRKLHRCGSHYCENGTRVCRVCDRVRQPEYFSVVNRAASSPLPPGGILIPAPTDLQNGECGRSSRPWFVYVGPRARSLLQPAAPYSPSHSYTSLSIMFCFQNADTYTLERLVEVMYCVHTAFFCSVFAGSRLAKILFNEHMSRDLRRFSSEPTNSPGEGSRSEGKGGACANSKQWAARRIKCRSVEWSLHAICLSLATSIVHMQRAIAPGLAPLLCQHTYLLRAITVPLILKTNKQTRNIDSK